MLFKATVDRIHIFLLRRTNNPIELLDKQDQAALVSRK